VLGDPKVAASGAGQAWSRYCRTRKPRAFLRRTEPRKARPQPAVEPLFKVLAENDDADPILRHGAVMGLVGCATAEKIAAKASDPSAAVRGGAVVALRRLKSPLVAAFLQDADQSVVLEAARAIHDAPIPEALPALAELVTNLAIQDATFSAARSTLTTGSGNWKTPASARGIRSEQRRAGDRAEGRDRRAQRLGASRSERSRLNQWRPLPDREADDAVTAFHTRGRSVAERRAERSAGSGRATRGEALDSGAGEPLFQLASNESGNTAARVEALRAADFASSTRNSRRQPGLPSPRRTRSCARRACKRWRSRSRCGGEGDRRGDQKRLAREKQGAVLALAEIKSKDAEALLDDLLDALITARLAPEVQLDAARSRPRRSRRKRSKTRSRFYEAAVAKGNELAKWRVSLAGGNVERDGKIFREKAETQCLRCHKNEIGDSVVGPDLTRKFGKTKIAAYLLDPS